MTPHPNWAMVAALVVASPPPCLLCLAWFSTGSTRNVYDNSRGSRLVPSKLLCNWVAIVIGFGNVLIKPPFFVEQEISRGSHLIPREFSRTCSWTDENSRGNDLGCLWVGFLIVQPKRCSGQMLCMYKSIHRCTTVLFAPHESIVLTGSQFAFSLGINFARTSFDFVLSLSRYVI